MVTTILLLVCLLLGAALRHWRVVPSDAHQIINQLLVTVFIPALTLLYVLDMHLTRQFWLPVLAPWLVFIAGLLFFGLIARFGSAGGPVSDRATLGTARLTRWIRSWVALQADSGSAANFRLVSAGRHDYVVDLCILGPPSGR